MWWCGSEPKRSWPALVTLTVDTCWHVAQTARIFRWHPVFFHYCMLLHSSPRKKTPVIDDNLDPVSRWWKLQHCSCRFHSCHKHQSSPNRLLINCEGYLPSIFLDPSQVVLSYVICIYLSHLSTSHGWILFKPFPHQVPCPFGFLQTLHRSMRLKHVD